MTAIKVCREMRLPINRDGLVVMLFIPRKLLVERELPGMNKGLLVTHIIDLIKSENVELEIMEDDFL